MKNLSIVQIACICHTANADLCHHFGDDSQKPWAVAEQWQRDSALLGVQFRLQNPHALPSAQHEAWLQEKEKGGWKYGPIKDPAKKEHPCMVAYSQLPLEQQAKDHLFCAIVDALSPLLTVAT